ncbi:MAG: hypothetical protein H0Z39_02705 [Peptococcaceae bacterium]|nr:hypothetical protein [Peptococcaceae bacterium]
MFETLFTLLLERGDWVLRIYYWIAFLSIILSVAAGAVWEARTSFILNARQNTVAILQSDVMVMVAAFSLAAIVVGILLLVLTFKMGPHSFRS